MAAIELGFSRIFGFAYHGNAASWRVLEKIGMKFIYDSMFHGHAVKVYKIEEP